MHILELSPLISAYIPALYPFIPVTYSTTADITLNNSEPGAEIGDSLSSTDSSNMMQAMKVFDDSFDDEMCAIYNLYTDTFESIEPPSHTEFDLRGEFISSEPCALSIQKILSDTSDPRADCSLSFEPEDDLPSYQESIAVAERSYSYAQPRIRAEFLYVLFLPLLFLALRFAAFASASCVYCCNIVSTLCFAFKADHNFENRELAQKPHCGRPHFLRITKVSLKLHFLSPHSHVCRTAEAMLRMFPLPTAPLLRLR
jgi:hypothetical protein